MKQKTIDWLNNNLTHIAFFGGMFALLIAVSVPVYAQTVVCSQFVLHTIQLQPILDCIDSSISKTKVGQTVGSTYLSITKTDIGTSYANIYNTIFDEENQIRIDFTNAQQVRIIFLWDYVGVGNHQVRLVDASNANNILIETSTFNADCNPCETTWANIPSWAINQNVLMNWQGKSSTATDDPIAKGFQVQIR